jgi:Rad3-related DNA helicase
MSREKLRELQINDKTGRMISLFKSKMSDALFTTKCSRGVDFPGDICNSIIFTKYPNPNVRGVFWKILQKTHQKYYWDFYRDKARREFLQRIYRAVRSKDDHVFILSPDLRVLNAVKELQMNGNKK